MLKIINKNKNFKDKSCGARISTATMSLDEYMQAVESGILPYWADQELMRKTGIQNLFAENAVVTNALSYEDACDCLERASKMVNMATYVCMTFVDRVDDLMRNDSTNVYHLSHEFYSADTIRDLFIESQKQPYEEVEHVADLDQTVKRLNAVVRAFYSIKRSTFGTIIMSAHLASAEMSGFKN